MVEPMISQDGLLPSEATVLETLASADTQWTQRALAQRTGYSIGLINTILKKLSNTGYIKIANVNKRRLQYLLTPQGFAVASKVACTYILRTFREYRQLYHQISGFFEQLYIEGHRNLHVCCDDTELQNLIGVVIKDSNLSSKLNFCTASAGNATIVHLKGAAVTESGPCLQMSIQHTTRGAA